MRSWELCLFLANNFVCGMLEEGVDCEAICLLSKYLKTVGAGEEWARKGPVI